MGLDAQERVDDRRARARRDTDRRVTDVVEKMSDAFLAIGPDWCVTYANREVARLNGVPAEALVGRDHWEVWPETVGGEVERVYRRVMAEHVPAQFEHYYPQAGVWHDIRVYPSDDGGIAVFYRDVTAQKRLQAEREQQARDLADAMVAAQSANRAKSQFLANTSHEIRTPLNAVIGYAELLSVGLAGPLAPQQTHYVERIQAASRHLLGLVNDVLDLAKIEAGQMRAAREPGLVLPVAEGALEIVEPQARDRNVTLTNACGREARAFVGDPERVRQILVNLLSNAVRFTESGGRVTMACGTAAALPSDATTTLLTPPSGWTFIRVEDTGIGIPANQLDHIWGAFEQADSSHTRKVDGSGLGLTISRHLARLMGGDITVRTQVGLGSSFVLWLPAVDPKEVRDAPAEATRVPNVHAEREPAEMMAEIGEALVADTERILATYIARLRTDPTIPRAHDCAAAQLEDHAATFVVDVAQCLSQVGLDASEAAAMLRDGSAIQRLVATCHGAQRARLGWHEEDVRREYQILREELHAAAHRHAAHVGAADATPALAVIDHMIDRAESQSLAALRGEA